MAEKVTVGIKLGEDSNAVVTIGSRAPILVKTLQVKRNHAGMVSEVTLDRLIADPDSSDWLDWELSGCFVTHLTKKAAPGGTARS